MSLSAARAANAADRTRIARSDVVCIDGCSDGVVYRTTLHRLNLGDQPRVAPANLRVQFLPAELHQRLAKQLATPALHQPQPGHLLSVDHRAVEVRQVL